MRPQAPGGIIPTYFTLAGRSQTAETIYIGITEDGRNPFRTPWNDNYSVHTNKNNGLSHGFLSWCGRPDVAATARILSPPQDPDEVRVMVKDTAGQPRYYGMLAGTGPVGPVGSVGPVARSPCLVLKSSTTVRKPWILIRFPCKYQPTLWFQPWFQSGAKWI